MTLPRSQQVDLDITPYYHCVARCVRRAFLCGQDAVTGRSFEHRKQWLVQRIKLVADVFAVDICAYAIMSNHFHLLVRIDRDRAAKWTDAEVMERVGRIYRGAFDGIDEASQSIRENRVALWRERLASLSWVMRCLNEWLARRANREDDCKGRFWEGRFSSQALLDMGAVVACMSYIDLNPVRAGLTSRLDGSLFTSVHERLRAVSVAEREGRSQPTTPPGLAPFIGERSRSGHRERLEIAWLDYIELVDWTGRAVREDKKGAVRGPPPKILATVQINDDTWLDNVREWGTRMGGVVGQQDELAKAATARGLQWCKGKRRAAALYQSN